MVDIECALTESLIEELAKRKGVTALFASSKMIDYEATTFTQGLTQQYAKIHKIVQGYGPATILVIKHD